MKISRPADIIINVFSPVILGFFIYRSGSYLHLLTLFKNYFPDGLWAYAFMSAVLITWNRVPNLFWIITVAALCFGTEAMQFFHWMPGTADIADIAAYSIGIGLGLLSNMLVRKSYPPPAPVFTEP